MVDRGHYHEEATTFGGGPLLRILFFPRLCLQVFLMVCKSRRLWRLSFTPLRLSIALCKLMGNTFYRPARRVMTVFCLSLEEADIPANRRPVRSRPK
jgi:hypothetical protein